MAGANLFLPLLTYSHMGKDAPVRSNLLQCCAYLPRYMLTCLDGTVAIKSK